MFRKKSNKIPNAAMLEEVILGKTKKKSTQKLFKSRAVLRWHKALEIIRKKHRRKRAGQNIWWWEPPKQSLPVEFCNESSMHGLRHIVQPKRHLTERIFWIFAFLAGVIVAGILIYDVWSRYLKNPVIVTFQSTEMKIGEIPFPAVTVCSMNKFTKSKYQELKRMSEDENLSEKERSNIKIQLAYVNNVCTSEESFAEHFNYSQHRGPEKHTMEEDEINFDLNIGELLLANTPPCEELIRLCIWAEERVPCETLFKPIVTDYGKCCVFNHLPVDLLIRQTPELVKPNRDLYKRKPRWTPEEKDEWRGWDISKHYIPLSRPGRFPRIQRRAGMPFGLRFLVDGNTDDYLCPISDSEGFRFELHVPLEFPHVRKFGSVLELGKEIYVTVEPDVYVADESIKHFELSKRQCYVDQERKLDIYAVYTASNCVDECEQNALYQDCNCSMFYTPQFKGIRTCVTDERTEEGKKDWDCIKESQENLHDRCINCESLCENVEYNYATTISQLQDASFLWNDVGDDQSPPDWGNNKVSIVNIYFGDDSVVPKFRKKLAGTTDLIADTGGLLGLCLGFSVISGAEFIYFITMRAYWHAVRRRAAGKQIANKFMGTIGREKTSFVTKTKRTQLYDKRGKHGAPEKSGSDLSPYYDWNKTDTVYNNSFTRFYSKPYF